MPCSRADVFESKLVSMLEKRKMMKFLAFCSNFEQAVDVEGHIIIIAWAIQGNIVLAHNQRTEIFPLVLPDPKGMQYIFTQIYIEKKMEGGKKKKRSHQ